MRHLILCGGLMLWGCAYPLRGAMRPAKAVSLEAAHGSARVVFVRADPLLGFIDAPFIFDGLRRLPLGQSINRSYFAVDLEPGAYQLCPALMRFELGRQPTSAFEFERLSAGVHSPLTLLEVAAGKTYVLQVNVRAGGYIELLPVRPGTWREHVVLADLPSLRPAEVDKSSPHFGSASDPGLLDDWFEICRESSGTAVRLRMDREDGTQRSSSTDSTTR